MNTNYIPLVIIYACFLIYTIYLVTPKKLQSIQQNTWVKSTTLFWIVWTIAFILALWLFISGIKLLLF